MWKRFKDWMMTKKAKAITDAVMALLMLFTGAFMIAKNQPYVAVMLFFNSMVFSFGSGSALMMHVHEGFDKANDEFEKSLLGVIEKQYTIIEEQASIIDALKVASQGQKS